MYYAQKRLRIEKDVVVRISRVLQGKGKLFVASGQEVAPDEILGSCEYSSGFRTLNIANILSINPLNLKKYLRKNLGQRIYKGELLAQKSGWFGEKKIAVSPTDGILDHINEKTGEVRLTFLPQKMDLPAGLYGVVEGVDQNLGLVVIRTQVSKIYGVFGSGRVRDGILHFSGGREELVTRSIVTPNYTDCILVGGSTIFKDAISAAISQEIKGIITGGINASDYKAMAGGRIVFPKKLENDIGISIVIVEGFGSIPIGEDIFSTLKEYDGKFVFLNGNSGEILLPSFEISSMIRVRKTSLPKISSKESGQTFLREAQEIKTGDLVRVIGTSFAGEQGKVIYLDKSPTLLASGIKGYLITLETKRRRIKIPAQNLEIIG